LASQTAQPIEETHWEKAAETRMGKYLTHLETDFILKSVDPTKISLVIDVGAEAGRFSLMAANSKVSVIGIDIDSYSLRRLKRKNKDVPVILADARKMPLKDGVFDAVFMVEVLDYIPELGEALQECSRILKADSSVVLSFGNQSSLKAKLRALRGKSYTHAYKEVTKTLEKSGFQVKAKMGYNWLPFGRISQSPFVGFLAGAEKVFGLRRLPSLSPWVMLHAVKSR
jgi:ubiquinone/menaquinone biosynthesis C-methylase UbiE